MRRNDRRTAGRLGTGGNARSSAVATRRLLTTIIVVATLALAGLTPGSVAASAVTRTDARSGAAKPAAEHGPGKSVEETQRARARARLLKADRTVVRAAPRGVEALVLWLRAVAARSPSAPLPTARVQADVVQLDRIAQGAVHDLARMPDRRAQRLLMAVVRTEVRPAMEKTHSGYVANRAFFFYTNVQRRLEQMGRAAGSTGQVTFLPRLARHGHTLTSYRREFVVDQDRDEVSDAFDEDIDDTGGANSGDRADNVLGIPDQFLVRTPFVAGPVSSGPGRSADGAQTWRSCFMARESVPRLMTVRAATRFQTKRRCGTAARATATPSPDVPPGNTSIPATTGSAVVGSTLSADPGDWLGSPAPTFTYRWQFKNDTGGWPDIPNATSQTYVVQPGDLGRVLRVNVTATNAAGSAEQISAELGPVTQADDSAPANISLPTIAGTPTVGGQLSTDAGSWSGSPTGYAYQWQRGTAGVWTSIDQATGPSYIPDTTDVGYALRVQVTADNQAGQATVTSAATTKVPGTGQSPVNTALPAISGKPVVGSVLTASSGTWTGSPTPGYDFAWQRSTSSGSWAGIAGAGNPTYTPVGADVGQSLRVVVTASSSAGSAAVQSPELGPVTSAANGCAVSSATDTDHDGVPDCKEIAGFNLVIATTGTGSTTTRHVTSDPTSADTDGDGISDGTEWQGSVSDPSDTDTDGDGLDDFQEFIVYKSLPANVDTDGDAVIPGSNPRSADPRLLDGTEVNGYSVKGTTISTSPTLADTDGDTLSDYTEINGGGFNPLVADMPKLQVGVPDNVETNIQIFTTRKDGTSSTTYKGTTTTSTDSTKTHAVDLTNVKTLNTNSTTLDVGAKGGVAKGKPYGEAHLNVKSTWQTGTVTDHQSGSTTDTTKTTQQRYQQYQQDVSTTDAVTKPTGTLSTAITLQNTGTVSYTVQGLTVTAFRADPNNPGSIQPIATLKPDSSVGNLTLAPGDTKGPIQVSADDVSSDLLVALLADPNGIIYSIPSPSLVNPANQQSYAVVGQTVQAQTAGVTIDDGSNRPRTYLVATNVARNPDGSSAGVDMHTVLTSILHQEYATCTQKNPDNPGDQSQWRQVLCSVGDVATTDEDHFWSLLASTDLPLGNGDFDDLQLKVGSAARLVYLVDTDGDGLFDPQEGLFGTDVTLKDTDADGLSDFDETQTGWTVPAIGPNKAYQVFSSPVATDVDGDGAEDSCPSGLTTCGPGATTPEDVRLTDPNQPDTNDDGLLDGAQSAADSLAYCVGCYRSPDFDKSFGSGSGDGDGEFGDAGPGALGVNASTEDVFVADTSNHRVEKFGADGTFALDFGSAGTGLGQFQDITGVAVDRQGNVYVTDVAPDYTSGRLQKFTSNGTHVATTSVTGWSVAVDGSGLVYVHAQEGALSSSDRQRTSVRRYSPTLSLLRTYPSAPTSPIYVTSSPRQGPYLSGTTVGADGRVLVSSGFVFGNGNPASFYQWLQPSDGSWQPTQLTFAHTLYEGAAVDRAGHLYLSDAVNDSLVKLSPRNLTTIYAQLGGTGTGNGNFSGPVGVAVDDDCSVYVSDAGNSRVQKLSYATGCG